MPAASGTAEHDVVKRIKKRIPRAEGEAPENGAEDEFEDDDKPGGESATETLEHLSDKLGEVNQDEFVDYGAKALEWVVQHRVKLVGVVVLSIVAATVINQYQKHQRATLEAKASVFLEANKNLNDGRQLTAAMTMGEDKAPKDAPTAEARKASLEKARDGFQTALSDAGDKPLGHISALGLAGTQFELGKLDDALKLYDQVAGDEKLDPIARALAYQGRATVLEAQNKPADAVETWKKIEAMDAKSYGLLVGMNVGRLLEKQGKPADAKAIYVKLQKDQQAVLDQFGNQDAKRELERRLAKLDDGT